MSPAVLEAMKIDGWMSSTELQWLLDAAAHRQIVIEVGSYKGRSTKALASSCPGTVYAVDPWAGPYFRDNGKKDTCFDSDQFEAFAANLKDELASGKVIAKKALFADLIDRRELPRADMVFVDGDHRYFAVRRDIDDARQILRQGGLLCGHDYGKSSWPGVKKAVDEVFKKVQLVGSIWSVSL